MDWINRTSKCWTTSPSWGSPSPCPACLQTMRKSALKSSRVRELKGGLVELAEGKEHEELLDVERRVPFLEDLEALDEALHKHLAEFLRSVVVGQDPAVHWPAARAAESSSIHELA